MTGDEILTVEEIAARLKLRESWVYNHAESLGGYKLGKYWRFLWSRVMTRIGGDQSLAPQPNDSQLIDSRSRTERLEQTWNRLGTESTDENVDHCLQTASQESEIPVAETLRPGTRLCVEMRDRDGSQKRKESKSR